jgi:hypothetical protein
LPVQGVVGFIVRGQVLVFCSCTRHQFCRLSGSFLSSCDFGFGFGFGFSFSLGFGFCGESPVGKVVICEVIQFLEIEVCSWMDVALVDEVWG